MGGTMSPYIEPPDIPEGQTVDQYRRARPRVERKSRMVVNACRQWTKLGNPIRHRGCADLPVDECREGAIR